jgi:hypothetical protein
MENLPLLLHPRSIIGEIATYFFAVYGAATFGRWVGRSSAELRAFRPYWVRIVLAGVLVVGIFFLLDLSLVKYQFLLVAILVNFAFPRPVIYY